MSKASRRRRKRRERTGGGDNRSASGRNGDRHRRQKGMKNLHEAAKFKRILSAADYWFSEINLRDDASLREEMEGNGNGGGGGWCTVRWMLRCPKFWAWTDAELIVRAFWSTEGRKRYEVGWLRTSVESSSRDDKAKFASTLTDEGRDLFPRSDEGVGINQWDWQWEELTVVQLKDELRLRGLMVSGSKAELVERLEEADADAAAILAKDGNSATLSDKNSNGEAAVCMNSEVIEGEKEHEGIAEEHEPKYEYSRALVRRKGIRGRLARIEREEVQRSHLSHDELDELDQQIDLAKAAEVEARAKERRRMQSLPKYDTDSLGPGRKIIVVEAVEELDKLDGLCNDLRRSAERARERWGDDRASALGFDAEYATLELDIRSTLPALLQLSAPPLPAETDVDRFGSGPGLIVLIWLDKFPNHGKNVLNDVAYAPLRDLLSDPTILKVGASASADARNLAAWWGVTDVDYVDHFFSGLVDLEEQADERLHDKSLQEMCAVVLGRDLRKDKVGWQPKGRKGVFGKKKREKLSHWRAKAMTTDMKTYAAQDGSCAVDVWATIHGFVDRAEKGR